MPHPSPFRRAALAPAALLVAALAACARGDAAPARAHAGSPFDRAVRSLRHAVVGDAPPAAPARPASRAPRPRVARTVARAAGRPAPHDSAAAVSAVGFDTTAFPTVVIPFTTTEAPPVTIWQGDTLQLPIPTPPAGTPSSIARDLRWTSAEQAVAMVSAEGAVIGRSPGTAQIIAYRRVGQVVTRVTVRPAVRGRVVAADGAPVPARVVVRGGGAADTVLTGDGGWFVLRSERDLGPALSLRVEPLGAGGRPSAGYAPALVARATPGRLADVDVVLLPARWRVAAGSYAGASVAIQPTVVHGRVRDGMRLWRQARPGRAGTPDDGAAVGWAPARLPLPLAFDRRGSGASIGAGDSVAFWGIVRQLERDWGAPLFRPATLVEGEDGFGGVVVGIDPRIGSEGIATTGWNGDGDLYDAQVAVRTRALLGDPTVVTHELLHALGLGHAPYGVASVMHPTATAGTAGRATVDDVAYGQLLYAIRARSRGGRTTIGIAGAAAAAEERP